jgi:putative membrane protein
MTADIPLGDIASAWSFPPWPSGTLILTAAIYLRGWWRVRQRRSRELPAWRALVFCLGLAAIWLVLASPIDALDDYLLVAHMTQHLVLMSVGPPLIVLGAPTVPLLQGLPRFIIRRGLSFFFRRRWFHSLINFLTHPTFAWLSMNIAYLGWHIPAAYELTLRSEGWHNLEHIIFVLTSTAFWWRVIEPWPSHNRLSRWMVLPYMISADLVNTLLSASLAFSGRVVYPSYEAAPRVMNLSALNDQIAAGAEMWVLGSIIFLIPAAFVLHRILSPKSSRQRRATLSRKPA